MTYENIIEIASEVANNEKIIKSNLTLVYELDETNHRKLDESLFYKTKQHESGIKFEHQEVIEVSIGDVNFKFIKKNLEN